MTPAQAHEALAAAAPLRSIDLPGHWRQRSHVGTDTTDTNGAEYTVPRSSYAHLVPSAVRRSAAIAKAQKGTQPSLQTRLPANGTQRTHFGHSCPSRCALARRQSQALTRKRPCRAVLKA